MVAHRLTTTNSRLPKVAPHVRVLAATNHDLEPKTLEGRFGEDLYFRLAGIPIDIPPLRQRTKDIPSTMSSAARHWLRVRRRLQLPRSERSIRIPVATSQGLEPDASLRG